MGIWFLTARRRWSIRSMAMSNGAAARGNTTRQRQLTLIGLLTAITFDDAAPLARRWCDLPRRSAAKTGAATLGDDGKMKTTSMRLWPVLRVRLETDWPQPLCG